MNSRNANSSIKATITRSITRAGNRRSRCSMHRLPIMTAYEGYSWESLIGIGWTWVGITFLVSFVFALQPWKTECHLEKGRGDDL